MGTYKQVDRKIRPVTVAAPRAVSAGSNLAGVMGPPRDARGQRPVRYVADGCGTEPLLIASLDRRVERRPAGLIGDALHRSVTRGPAGTVRGQIDVIIC